jgi:hypothetical protein
MSLSEAKELIGKICSIQYKDRSGNELSVTSKIYDATYVPLYGGYLVTEQDDIRFDRIIRVVVQSEAVPSTPLPVAA